MIDKLKNILPDWINNNSNASTGNNESLHLSYENMEIGVLHYNNGLWVFKYSEEFINQNEIQPLMDFPDKNKVYKSEHLWPFFVSRIPPVTRPSIKEIIKSEKLDENNLVQLLKRFGQRSIANPFLLKSNIV